MPPSLTIPPNPPLRKLFMGSTVCLPSFLLVASSSDGSSDMSMEEGSL